MTESSVCHKAELTEQAPTEQPITERAFIECVLTEPALTEWAIAPREAQECVSMERTFALAESIMALDEPWRARFIQLTARYAGVSLNGGAIAQEELAGWLADVDLYERIGLMLRSWTASK